jgi:hypothetical protein
VRLPLQTRSSTRPSAGRIVGQAGCAAAPLAAPRDRDTQLGCCFTGYCGGLSTLGFVLGGNAVRNGKRGGQWGERCRLRRAPRRAALKLHPLAQQHEIFGPGVAKTKTGSHAPHSALITQRLRHCHPHAVAFEFHLERVAALDVACSCSRAQG